MRCPNCASSIPDGSVRCPACRAPIDTPFADTDDDAPRARYCPSCGALAPVRARSCPKCGRALEPAPEPEEEGSVPSFLAAAQADDDAVPFIESAIPSEEAMREDYEEQDWGVPRKRVVAVVAAAIVVLAAIVALLVFHPWSSGRSATEPADLSGAGALPELGRLTGQDTRGDEVPVNQLYVVDPQPDVVD